MPGTGGVPATGGIPGTGGVPATGGIPGTGGVPATGGIPGTGGLATGGAAGSPAGGKSGSGGMGTGGVPGTGGTTCTNSCSSGATDCATSTETEVCQAGGDGCLSYKTTACASGLVCERSTVSCADPGWAEWPVPNCQNEVTAGASNLESYVDNQNGTVTDNVTGLMWQQTFAAGTYDYSHAVMYCQSLNLGGHQDWRLPTIVELVSILDYGQLGALINTTYFKGATAQGLPFWASTPLPGSPLVNGVPQAAWYVDFSVGLTSSTVSDTTDYVRCAR
jgi:hypothetical protein